MLLQEKTGLPENMVIELDGSESEAPAFLQRFMEKPEPIRGWKGNTTLNASGITGPARSSGGTEEIDITSDD